MSEFIKKQTIPSVDKPGIYHNVSDSLNGIGVDDYEKFSLGNWTSLFRQNRIFLDFINTPMDSRGLRVMIKSHPIQRMSYAYYYIERAGGNDDGEVQRILGPFHEKLPGSGGSITIPLAAYIEGIEQSYWFERYYRSWNFLNHFYDNVRSQNDYGTTVLNGNGGNHYKFYYSQEHGGVRKREKYIDFNDGFAFLQPRKEIIGEEPISTTIEIDDWRDVAPDLRTTDSNCWAMLFDDFLAEKIKRMSLEIPFPRLNSNGTAFERASFGRYGENLTQTHPDFDERDIPRWTGRVLRHSNGEEVRGNQGYDEYTHILMFPSQFNVMSIGSSGDIEQFDNATFFDTTVNNESLTDGIRLYNVANKPIVESGFSSGYNFTPEKGLVFGVEPYQEWDGTVLPGNNDITEKSGKAFKARDAGNVYAIFGGDNGYANLFLGYPNFRANFIFDDDELMEELSLEQLDFLVNVKANYTNPSLPQYNHPLLYYSTENIKYTQTSFPLSVKLRLELFDATTNEIIQHYNQLEEELDTTQLKYSALYVNESQKDNFFRSMVGTKNDNNEWEYDLSVENFYYRYQVIQWGDEETLLTDDDIKANFFFKQYDSSEYPKATDVDFQIFLQKNSRNSKPIQEELSHLYNTPGIKQIKIVVHRYTKNGVFILQSYLINKNIVINDGNMKLQDFEIFGGTDFNFLPLEKNQIIINGLGDESKHVQSSKQIKDDDFYGLDDYLSKTQTNNFMKNFKDGLYGKDCGKIDLGNIRTLRGVKKLNDMIENFHIDSGSKDNTLVSNIFIDKMENNLKRDVTLEINPQKNNFDSIDNSVGTKKTAVLIGDYELEKEDAETPIRKKGFMNTPQIDANKDKQAI